MVTKKVLWMLIVIGLCSFVSAEYCYQESANISSVCGGLSYGNYSNWLAGYSNPTHLWTNGVNVYDGNKSSFGYGNNTNSANLIIEYVIPEFADNNSLWEVTYLNTSITSVNLSINKTCWDYAVNNNSNVLVFHVWSLVNVSNFNISYFECQYSNNINDRFRILQNTNGDFNHSFIYEESMYWTKYKLHINVYDYNNNVVDLPFVYFNGTNINYSSKPIEINKYEFINFTQNMSYSFNSGHINNMFRNNDSIHFVEGNIDSNISIYLPFNRMNLAFRQNGALKSVDGYIADENKSFNFSDTTFLTVQNNLTEGYVHVRLNSINNVNWTQYYEYYNDLATDVNETIEILVDSDWSAYFRVLDYANAPLKDALIRVDFSNHYETYPNVSVHKLMGQRLTDDNGYTFFFADKASEVLITVTKDGYEPYQMLLSIGDESFSKAEAFQIYMKPSDNLINDNVWLYLQRDFTNRSLDISGGLLALGKDKVEVITDYMVNNNLARKDISSSKDKFSRYRFTLYSGTDFSLSTTDDVIVYIYIDNVLHDTVTIGYDDEDKQYQFTGIPSLVESSILNPVLFILLIITCFGVSLFFRNNRLGETVFRLGSIVLASISLQFIMMAMVVSLSFVFKWIYEVMGE